MTTPKAETNYALYNFYRRYRWTEDDFTGWQHGMVGLGRGMFEGLFGGAVMEGLGYLGSSSLTVAVDGGIAAGPSGNLLVIGAQVSGSFASPAGNPARSLVVIRPKIVDDTPITRPTAPFDSVYLKELQEAEVVILNGTPAASPVYPTPAANDVVLFGVRLAAAASSFVATDVDLEVRAIPGKNSDFQQNQAKYDDRLRPYRFSSNQMGIKPSQLGPSHSRAFSYVNKVAPSIFPKDGSGNYNGDAAGDTFLNFKTGAITGADLASSAFTPTIPTAGNAIVATIGITTGDVVTVAYGLQGTRAQCFAGIVNQKTTGAGSLVLPSNAKLVAFVVVYSGDGTNVTELDFVDCRGIAAVGTVTSGVAGTGTLQPSGGSYPLTLTTANDGQVILIDTTAARTINLLAPVAGFKVTFVDISGLAGTNAVTLHRAASERIAGLTSDFLLEANFGRWTITTDGIDWFFLA